MDVWSQRREGAGGRASPAPPIHSPRLGFLTPSPLRRETGRSGLAPSILSFHYGLREGEVHLKFRFSIVVSSPPGVTAGKSFKQMVSDAVRMHPKFFYAKELSSATAEVMLNCGVTLRGIMQRDSPAIRQGAISRSFGRTGSRHPRLVAQGCLSPVLLTQQTDRAADSPGSQRRPHPTPEPH